MTVAGIVAHHSALKDGELMKIPQYVLRENKPMSSPSALGDDPREFAAQGIPKLKPH